MDTKTLWTRLLAFALACALVVLPAGCASDAESSGSANSEDASFHTIAESSADAGRERDMTEGEGMPYTADTLVSDVMADPAFDGFGRLLFPVDAGYMQGSTLGDIHLTWYSAIDPSETAAELNQLREDALSGRQVFFPIYSEQEMSEDPRKRDTGLFFFRGNTGARTAICNAGGGFAYVAALHDSFPHAFELSKMGYNAFALIYRPGARTACEDLSRAIAFLFENAEALGVDMDGYSLWGGSAGARMAAWVGTHGTQAFGGRELPKPAAVIMEYTGLSEVNGSEPPTFSVVGTADGIADWRVMESRTNRIRANGTPAEIEVFEGLFHGFGLGTGTQAEGWIEEAVRFWQEAIETQEENR